MVKNPNAQQTKAFKKLRQACQMVVLLNGTPGKPEETYAQFDILSPDILGVRNFWAFKARYCVKGGYGGKEIVGYQRMEEFAAKTAPYILQRSADTLGLDKPIELSIEARLTPDTWRHYVALRDDFLTYLDGLPSYVQAPQAGVRAMRMSQVLAGFVGGVTIDDPEGEPAPADGERQIGREKRQAVIDFLMANSVQQAVLWCKFRPEMQGLADDLGSAGTVVYMLHGGQSPDDREDAKRAFAPGQTPSDDRREATCPTYLVGHPAAGGAGLNLARANFVIFPTPATLRHRQQGIGRVQRPGQTRTVRIVDVVAVGPDGQQTLDHHQLRAVRANEDITKWTAVNWKQALGAA
jgi:SNF2 family DNA or RNA helicase